MKDSEEKEHRISNLKDMINNIKNEDEESQVENNLDEVEEDSELINYLNEDKTNYDELEIDDEFIYHPGDEKDYAINLEENPINEEFIIQTPKTDENDEDSEISEFYELAEDFSVDLSENFDNVINAKIGKTPILAIVSTVIGVILVSIAALIFNSRSDRVIDNVVSGENNFMAVTFLIFGLLLLIYGIYRILDFPNPLASITHTIDSIEKDDKKENNEKKNKDNVKKDVKVKNDIPLNKESYKVGEFDIDEIKSKLKKPTVSSKPKATPTKKSEEKTDKGYVKANETESIDEIFADIEEIDDIPIISVDSKEEEKK